MINIRIMSSGSIEGQDWDKNGRHLRVEGGMNKKLPW